MRRERRWKVIALLASGMLAGMVLVGTPAGAHVAGWTHTWNKHIKPKADKRYQKVPQGPQHYSIPGSALVPDDGTRGDNFVTAPGQSLGWCYTGGNFYAPIHLPNGAKIIGFHVNYGDAAGSGASNGSIYITRMPFLGRGGTYNDIFTSNLANTPGAGDAATAAGALNNASAQVVSNAKWAYNVIGQGVPAGASICNIDVVYRVNAPFAAARVAPGAAVQSESAQ
jgi:hypothetical protein